jgi:hypothetical protein
LGFEDPVWLSVCMTELCMLASSFWNGGVTILF